MRKFFAGIAAMIVMLYSLNMSALAVGSPGGTPTTETTVEKSPKTGDQTLLYVELAGAALAVTAVVAKKRSAREA